MALHIKTGHPHIEKREGICGGSAVIKDTRIPVRVIAGFILEGVSVQEILDGYPDLTPSQIYDAESYYYDHREEIDQEIKESTLEHVQERHDLCLDNRGFLVPRS